MSGNYGEEWGAQASVVQPRYWAREEAERAVGLALLVVRAGARDSLGWWEDEALTEAGAFALRRIFPRDARRVAVRLAFRAARERHSGVLASAGVGRVTTLLDLTEALVEGTAVLPGDLDEPITSPDELRRRVRELAPGLDDLRIPQPQAFGLLDLSALTGRSDLSLGETVTMLAAGYLAGEKDRPVIPYFRSGREGAR
jgi:hypothetical protein